MILTLIICLITILCMITSIVLKLEIKIGKYKFQPYYLICLVGAILLLLTNRVSIEDVVTNMFLSKSMNPIKILILFFSMTFISIFLDEVGFFKYMAVLAIKYAKASQISLFTTLYVVISILTIFTSNDIIILTFTPFICFFCKNANINPIPYVVSEFVAANTLSMSLIIGNPTNIYISLSLGIDFITYFKKMFLIAIIVCIIAYGLLLVIFHKPLKVQMVKNKVEGKISNKVLLYTGLIILVSCTILMAISNFMNIDMYLISASFAILLLVFSLVYSLITKEDSHLVINTLKRLPYSLLVFLLSMFTLVLALNNYGVSEKIATYLSSSYDVFTYGYASFISCSFINNIPMSVLFSNIISYSSTISTNAIYATIAGSNIGAILSPIGALAGIMWLNLLKESNVKYSFIDFIRYGSIISITLMSITLVLIYFI